MTRAAVLLIAPLLASQAGCCVFPLFPRLGCCGAGSAGVPVGFSGPVGTPVGYGPAPIAVGGGDCVSCGKAPLIGGPVGPPVGLPVAAGPLPPPTLISTTSPSFAVPTTVAVPPGPPSVFNGPPEVIAPPASTPLPAPMGVR